MATLVDFTKGLSVREKEIFCDLSVVNDDFIGAQEHASKELYDVYKHGKGVVSNKWKAKKYADKASVALSAQENSALQKHTPYQLATGILGNTGSLYSSFGWFTSIRILFLGARKFLENALGSGLLLPFKNLLAIGGLSFALELIWDIFIMIPKAVFFPQGDEEKKLSYGERFWNVLFKDARANRMANAIVWLPINALGFFVTGGTSALLNIGGFIFDLFHEAHKAYVDIGNHTGLLDKLEEAYPKKQESPEVQEVKEKLKEQIYATQKNRAIIVGTTFIYALSIPFIFFCPPLSIPAIIFSSLFFSTVCFNVVRKFWNSLSSSTPSEPVAASPKKKQSTSTMAERLHLTHESLTPRNDPVTTVPILAQKAAANPFVPDLTADAAPTFSLGRS